MPNRSAVSRRAVLTAGGGAILVGAATAACGSRSGTTSPGAAPTAPAAPADSDLVDEVGQAIADAAARARAVASLAGLRPVARPFARLHAAHLERLGWTGTPATPTIGGADAARDTLVAAERRLQARLARAAGEAQSGALAQVLASMAGAIAQQLAVTA